MSSPVRSTNHGAAAVGLLMKPRSAAVIGVSAKAGTAGRTVLSNLLTNGFAGPIHIVGRGGGEIEGLPVLASADELPEGLDLAVLALPAAGVRDNLVACARRRAKAVTIFSSGFAEVGNRAEQDELAAIAEEAGIAMLGPNCLGYTNLVDGLPIGFASPRKVEPLSKDAYGSAIAMVSQSGGMMAYATTCLAARGLEMAYTVSTGNEAGIGVADFIEYFAQDEATAVVILYLEQVRDAPAFLRAAGRARAAGKSLVAILPGRGTKGKAAIQSHTGALADDYATMCVHLKRAGVALVDNMEELVDVVELLARYPTPPVAGPGILTFSGGFCALAHDFFEDCGIELPNISEKTRADLAPQLPDYIPPNNPLDLGTQVIWQPELTGIGATALVADPALGSVLIAINSGNLPSQQSYGARFVEAIKGSERPAIMAFASPELDPDLVALAQHNKVILSSSVERSMRAIASITQYGRALERAARSVMHNPLTGLPTLGTGPQPEWLGKQLLAAIGVRTPAGELSRDLAEAERIADEVGYPVALKAQAAALTHKTDAGGVVLNVRDLATLRNAWAQLHTSVERAQPGLALDGVLVEKMASAGIEMVIGAKRDPNWGPIVLVGLGGIWIEALGDVRLIAPDMAVPDIVDELYRLRSAKLLDGIRGAPPVDVEAIAETAALIGQLMLTQPDIQEIDLNPVFVHERGEGLTAVDALIINAGHREAAQ